MPRERTKGDPIQIRLPVLTDQALAARASEQGWTKAEEVIAIVAEALTVEVREAVQPKRRRAAAAGAADAEAAIEAARAEIDGCSHPRSLHTALNGGLVKCRCGKVRNMAQEWH